VRLLFLARETEQVFHDIRNAFALLNDAPAEGLHLFCCDIAVFNQLRIINDPVDGIIDLVCDAAGKGSDGFKLLFLAELQLHILFCFLKFLALSHVAQVNERTVSFIKAEWYGGQFNVDLHSVQPLNRLLAQKSRLFAFIQIRQ